MRPLASLLVLLLALLSFVRGVSGQCYQWSAGSSQPVLQADDAVSADLPLGFWFPGPGVLTYNQVLICTNGWMVLSVDGLPLGRPAHNELPGGSLPTGVGMRTIIAPYWGDLDCSAAGRGVYIERVLGVSATITWRAYDKGTNLPRDFQVVLDANGRISMRYADWGDDSVPAARLVGVALERGAPTTQVESLPTYSPWNDPHYFVRQNFHARYEGGQRFTLSGRALMLLEFGSNWLVEETCSKHVDFGVGCYRTSDSIYRYFQDAAAARSALEGRGIELNLTCDALASYFYAPLNAPLPFVAPPSGAQTVFSQATDDGEATISLTSLSFSFPVCPAQGVSELRINSNGYVSWGGGPQTVVGTPVFLPQASAMLAAPNSGVWSWYDYDETEQGSGRIVWHMGQEGPDDVLYVTWNGVEGYSNPPVANPSTMQMQFFESGRIRILWIDVDDATTNPFGSSCLVGFSPGGASVDAGPALLPPHPLAPSMPISKRNQEPLHLSAGPRPVMGSTTTFRIDNIPEYLPSVYLALLVLAAEPDYAGTELPVLSLRAPDCYLHLDWSSIFATVALVGSSSPTLTLPVSLPAAAQGRVFYAQAAGLTQPNSMPLNRNDEGLVTSNAILSIVTSY